MFFLSNGTIKIISSVHLTGVDVVTSATLTSRFWGNIGELSSSVVNFRAWTQSPLVKTCDDGAAKLNVLVMLGQLHQHIHHHLHTLNGTEWHSPHVLSTLLASVWHSSDILTKQTYRVKLMWRFYHFCTNQSIPSILFTVINETFDKLNSRKKLKSYNILILPKLLMVKTFSNKIGLCRQKSTKGCFMPFVLV